MEKKYDKTAHKLVSESSGGLASKLGVHWGVTCLRWRWAYGNMTLSLHCCFVFATSFLTRPIHAARLDREQFWYVDDFVCDIPPKASMLQKVPGLIDDFGQVSNLQE